MSASKLPSRPVALVLALAALSLAGCSKDKSGQQAESPSNAAGADVVAAEAEQVEPPKEAAAAPSEIEAPAFKVAMRASGEMYTVGEPANVEIVLNARGGYKCNDEYPYKFVPKDAPGLTYLTKVVKKDAIKVGKEESVMTIPVTPEAAGKQKVEGKFYFSVCNAETCLVEKKDLAFTLDVH
jgi:hypothetical protein